MAQHESNQERSTKFKYNAIAGKCFEKTHAQNIVELYVATVAALARKEIITADTDMPEAQKAEALDKLTEAIQRYKGIIENERDLIKIAYEYRRYALIQEQLAVGLRWLRDCQETDDNWKLVGGIIDSLYPWPKENTGDKCKVKYSTFMDGELIVAPIT